MGSYRIRFVSRVGAEYEVRIYPAAEGYVENGVTELMGGAEPIVTEEERSTDIMTAVRSSTGYVNIVTDDYTLQERLMPTQPDEMRVTLVRHAMEDETEQEDRVMWEGYVRPETFTQDWCGGPWEIQLPVVSRLGMVMDNYLSDGNTGLLTVGQWLHRICGDVYKWVLIPNNNLAISGTMQWGGESVATPGVLKLAWSEELFKRPIRLADRLDPSDTEHGLWDAGTEGDIASSLSVVLRWVFREDGDRLVCSDPGGGGVIYQRYSAASLKDTSAYPVAFEMSNNVAIEELGTEWPDTYLGGDDGTKEVLLPLGKVSVNGTTGKYNVTLLSASDEDWEKAGGIPLVNGGTEGMNRPDTVPFELYGDDSATIKSQKVHDNVELEAFRYTSGSVYISYSDGTTLRMDAGVRMDSPNDANKGRILGDTSMIYGNIFPSVVFGVPTNELKPGDCFGGGEISAIHYFYERNETYVHHRLNSVILGHLPFSAINKPALKLRTTLAQMLPYSTRQIGAITLKISGQVSRGKTYKDIDMASSFDGEDEIYGMEMSVKMGGYYIYKDTWGTHKCRLTTTESPFDVLWTKDNNGGFTESLKIGMESGRPMTLDDVIEITLYTPSNAVRDPSKKLSNNCKYLRIDNFQVSVEEYELPESYDTRETLIAESDTGIELSELVGRNKTEEVSLSTSFGGPDNPGALIAAIDVTIGGVRMSNMQARQVGMQEGGMDGARYLCKRTLAWLAHQGASTRYALRVPLRAERPWSVPLPMMVGEGDKTYYPAAREWHWRDDKVMLTMVEVR